MLFKKKSWVKVSVHPELYGAVPMPNLSSHFLPDSYKKLPGRLGGEFNYITGRTAKSCIPFFDAMTEGIIIPFPYDITITKNQDGELNWSWRSTSLIERKQNQPLVVEHAEFQVKGMFNSPVLKVISPYHIKTSDDILAYYMPVANSISALYPLSGLVNHGSDGYLAPVNFPSLFLGGEGEHVFKQGSPFVQVVFVKRSKFSFESGPTSEEEFAEAKRTLISCDLRIGGYKNLYRGKRN